MINVNNEVKYYSHTIFQVFCDPEQTNPRSIPTILLPITEVKGRKSCSSGQQTKFLQVKLWNTELERELQLDIKIQVSYDWNQSFLGCSSSIFHPLTAERG